MRMDVKMLTGQLKLGNLVVVKDLAVELEKVLRPGELRGSFHVQHGVDLTADGPFTLVMSSGVSRQVLIQTIISDGPGLRVYFESAG